MAQQDKTTFEGTFNNSSTGLFKTNTTKDIGSDDLRTLVDNLTDSVPFNQDDRYTWSFPQVSTTGTNTYAATPSPAITAYATGQAFKIKFTEASSGSSTLNLNGLGAKKLYTNPTTQATTGDIVDEQVYLLIYDAALDAASGGFLMIGGSGGGAVDSVNGQTGVVQINADDVPFTPAGNISATDVQAAIEELDTEKVSSSAVVGVQDFFIPAAAMKPRITDGCAELAFIEQAASFVNLGVLAFDQTTQEYAQYQTVVPRKWNNGTITVVPHWTAQAGSGTVRWSVNGGVYRNDDALTTALGTAQTSDDTLIATNDLHIGPATSAITLAGTGQDGNLLVIQVSRDPANDTLTADALLIGISVRFTTDAAIDG